MSVDKATGVNHIVLTVLIGSFCYQALPATAAEEGGYAIEEITVTARKREENLMDTPVSITAFSSDELKLRQIESIEQLNEATPNLVFRRHSDASGSNNNAVVYIRGIGQDDFVPTVEPGVGIYLDDTYIARSTGAVLDVIDVDSIQVLRGPQGTLFGRNTIGGAILINTKKPHEEFEGSVELSAGAYDHVEGKGMLNIPLAENFFARAAFMGRHKNGYVDLPLIEGDDGGGSDDTQAGRLALRWLPMSNLTVDASFDYTHTESDGHPGVLGSMVQNIPGSDAFDWNFIVAPVIGERQFTNAFYRPLEDRVSFGAQETGSDADIWGVSLTLDWDVWGVNVKTITSYRDLESEDQRDREHSPMNMTTVGDTMDQHQFSQEVQVSGRYFDDRLQWLLGFYYSEEKAVNINDVTFPFFHVISGAVIDNYSLAGFGQGTYDITEKLSLTFGLRYTKEDKESIVDDRIQYALALFDPTVPGGYLRFPPNVALLQPKNVFDANESEVDPYVNLSYHWTDDLMTYVSYSEGFKGGGFNQRIPPGAVVTSFSPEFATVYEVGFKWSGFERRLRLTGAGFYTDYTDLQITVQKLVAPSKENAGDAEIYGFEAEATALPIPQLQLSGGIGYLHAKYTELDPLATIPKSNELASAPDWQVNASAAYTLPVPQLAGSIVARLDWSWTDDYALDAANDNLQDSYHLLNVGLTYIHNSDKWEVALLGRNVTDELYLSAPGGELVNNGYLDVGLAPPAEYDLSFRYRF